jgi:hypothetical protein
MWQIHPNARTTPATRVEIARSGEPTGTLANLTFAAEGANRRFLLWN